MPGDVTPYLGLITSEHADKARFVATVAAVCQPIADITAVLNSLTEAFDIDTAVGAQLDVVGQWVGAARYVSTPLTNVYFSFDAAALGFDQGVWLGPGDPTDGLTALPDDIYRLLLKAKIAANKWDGTVPGAYAVWNDLFGPYGYQILIQDNGDMTMLLAMAAESISPTFLQLFIGSYLDLRPAGVGIVGRITPSAPAPFFGFDVENSAISGLDAGGWGIVN